MDTSNHTPHPRLVRNCKVAETGHESHMAVTRQSQSIAVHVPGIMGACHGHECREDAPHESEGEGHQGVGVEGNL